MKVSASLTTLSVVAVVSARSFTVKNSCSYTVWPAIFTDLNVGSAKPDHPTGYVYPVFYSKLSRSLYSGGKPVLAPRSRSMSPITGSPAVFGLVFSFVNKNKLKDARDVPNVISPATPDPHPAPREAATEDFFATPTPELEFPPPLWLNSLSPATEIRTIMTAMSLVDGFNVPMKITNNHNCGVPSCTVDLNPKCPAPLVVKDTSGHADFELPNTGPAPAQLVVKDTSDKIVGCNSACKANLDGNPDNSPNCCSGSYNTPDKCPSSGVKYYSYFKTACPSSYAYAYDDKTALFHCDSGLGADYTIEFCP
ncbi:Thaumatin-like protein 5 [Mycena venus]|uniref:Thaumatin-like protein 5 n=1 Tax=Mycena venus TaxID=2733690 RepID=A0A8H7CNF5_9AGAR|nr:Thaumatin-like protein 5 [Mycena venus]